MVLQCGAVLAESTLTIHSLKLFFTHVKSLAEIAITGSQRHFKVYVQVTVKKRTKFYQTASSPSVSQSQELLADELHVLCIRPAKEKREGGRSEVLESQTCRPAQVGVM